MATRQKITPFLWFNNQAEDAMNLYVSLFKNSKVLDVARSGAGGPGPEGAVFMCRFELDGQPVMALNGGPEFPQTEAFSFYVDCESQEEVDYFWDKLTANGGEESMCGWLKDPFGVSWQIVPRALTDMMSDPNPAKAQAATQAMLQMRKIDVAGLKRAYDAA